MLTLSLGLPLSLLLLMKSERRLAHFLGLSSVIYSVEGEKGDRKRREERGEWGEEERGVRGREGGGGGGGGGGGREEREGERGEREREGKKIHSCMLLHRSLAPDLVIKQLYINYM